MTFERQKATVPNQVSLCGIMYRVQVHEGLITFTEEGGIYGLHSQISFERDTDRMCWYLTVQDTFKRAMVAHIIKAFKVVEKYFGGDFVIKEPL